MYHIVRNFCGRKHSWISSHLRKFSPRNFIWVCPYQPIIGFNILQKISPWNGHFLLISEHFLPQKYPAIWYGTPRWWLRVYGLIMESSFTEITGTEAACYLYAIHPQPPPSSAASVNQQHYYCSYSYAYMEHSLKCFLDPCCNKYYDLIGQKQVSISHINL